MVPPVPIPSALAWGRFQVGKRGGVCEGSVVDGVDTVFEVLAGREGEIDGRRGFWPPVPIPRALARH